MRILILGGTVFVGRRIVEALAATGHELTLVNRGVSGPPPVATVDVRHADRNTRQLAEVLATGSWDATVDVSAYTSDQVERLADALGGRGGRYTLISTISVYDPERGEGSITEVSPVHEPVFGTDIPPGADVGLLYGARKVACELAARERFGDVLVVRPGVVAGAHDPTGRFTSYVERFAAAGAGDTVRLAGSADDPSQVIDARDLGAFVAALVEQEAPGVFNATGHDVCRTLGDVVDAARSAAGSQADVRWVDTDGADQAAMHPFYLSPGESWRRVFEIDPTAARAAGLRVRPLAETAEDALASVTVR